jgi:uncharacterized protein YxjI
VAAKAISAKALLMKFVLQEKLLGWGNDFSINDENGIERFFVDGKAFSIGKKLSFQDAQRRELFRIEQQLLAWGPTYRVLRGDEVLAFVRKKLFSLFRCRFEVDLPGPNDLEATGDFLDHEYVFRRGSEDVARVSKRWFSWRDTYGVEVLRAEDAGLILACAVVIDLVSHSDKD